MEDDMTTIPCPFVYANGKHCQGHVRMARAYGPSRGSHYVAQEEVRKYRLWCSEKEDHAGAVRTNEGKLRMEFYPRELAPGVENELWQSDLLG
ncbi:hypothetical protein EAH89_26185 [Roseomonas nepalensis]|uniref:Uncharacterized protein n=1 Tax=Muricoccus nepalensis TaxID=1854500 RepID=A0A502F8I3_9PROT|nr:hypothetical protein EAH89_26185 [Roseomonas nepalensis]